MNCEETQLEFKLGRQPYYATVVAVVGRVERSGTHQWNEMTSSHTSVQCLGLRAMKYRPSQLFK